MKVLLRLAVKLPGFVLQLKVIFDQALTRFFDFITCRDKEDDNFPFDEFL